MTSCVQHTDVRRALALTAVTAVWGSTFVLVKDAVAAYPVVAFLAYRFAIAALALAPSLRRARARTVLVGGGIGLALGAGYLFQTFGLRLTRASDAGLITGLFVVFTPLVAAALYRDRPTRVEAAGVLFACAGLALLLGDVPQEVVVGDLLVVGCAVLFALHIVLLSRYSAGHDAAVLTFSQLGAAALAFTLLAPLDGGAPPPSGGVLAAIVFTGLVATAAAFYIQTWAQRTLRSTDAALILSTEPAWALLFGIAVAGDAFGATRAVGAALLLAAPFFVLVRSARRAR